MHCIVYRSTRKADTYLFVEKSRSLDGAPPALRQMLGQLEKVIEIELLDGRRLARADASEVRRHIEEQGYYLQLPRAEGPPSNSNAT
jgi:uncharacterized protein YcgL (UPF0745 family)